MALEDPEGSLSRVNHAALSELGYILLALFFELKTYEFRATRRISSSLVGCLPLLANWLQQIVLQRFPKKACP